MALGLWIGRGEGHVRFVAGRRLRLADFLDDARANIGAGSTVGATALGVCQRRRRVVVGRFSGVVPWCSRCGSALAIRRVAAAHNLRTVGDYLEFRQRRFAASSPRWSVDRFSSRVSAYRPRVDPNVGHTAGGLPHRRRRDHGVFCCWRPAHFRMGERRSVVGGLRGLRLPCRWHSPTPADGTASRPCGPRTPRTGHFSDLIPQG